MMYEFWPTTEILERDKEWAEQEGLSLVTLAKIYSDKRARLTARKLWFQTYAIFCYWRDGESRPAVYHKTYLSNRVRVITFRVKRDRRDNYERYVSYPVRMQNKGNNPLQVICPGDGPYQLVKSPGLREWVVALNIRAHSTALQPVSIWGVTPRKDRWDRLTSLNPEEV